MGNESRVSIILTMWLARFARRWLVAASLVLTAVACGSTSESARAPTPSDAGTSSGGCPGGPVPTLVTVAQWTDIVSQLAGPCATVETVLASSAIDPHDYEPTPGDLARFEKAELVVRNGLDYDAWATKAVAALAHEPTVVDAGSVAGLKSGDNPHMWYGPSHVVQVADAITATLRELRPAAADLLQRQRSTFAVTIAPYLAEIDAIKQAKQGMTYGATEAVFDDMASALDLTNLTPAGFQRAAANEAEPAPGDLAAFETALESGRIDVLIYNTQTEGAVPQQIRAVARSAHVPVVDVTETPPDHTGFVDWQLSQLHRLADALSVP